jgi:site-specific DNA-methyltransferase (adenine-specific)
MSTKEDDIILDPFGGSGTTYVVCEKKKRKWIGIEIGSTNPIKDRLKNRNLEFHINSDYIEK